MKMFASIARSEVTGKPSLPQLIYSIGQMSAEAEGGVEADPTGTKEDIPRKYSQLDGSYICFIVLDQDPALTAEETEVDPIGEMTETIEEEMTADLVI